MQPDTLVGSRTLSLDFSILVQRGQTLESSFPEVVLREEKGQEGWHELLDADEGS